MTNTCSWPYDAEVIRNFLEMFFEVGRVSQSRPHMGRIIIDSADYRTTTPDSRRRFRVSERQNAQIFRDDLP